MRNLTIKAASWAQTRRFHQEEEGQTVIEYALVVGLVSIVLAVALVGLGNKTVAAMQAAVDAVPGVTL
jgi:Flp pilus assembly pilin Flp